MDLLDKAISAALKVKNKNPEKHFIPASGLAEKAVAELKLLFPDISDYAAVHILIHHESFSFTTEIQEDWKD
jgi:ferrous iron transport protein B